MSRILDEVTAVRGCTCGGHLYHRSSEPRCALLDIDDAADVQERLDEACARVQAYIDAKNAELQQVLAGPAPCMSCVIGDCLTHGFAGGDRDG